jgi:hypothetical protein
LYFLSNILSDDQCHYGHHAEGVSRDFCLDPTSVLRIGPIQNVVFVLPLLSTIEQNKNTNRDKDQTLSVYIKSMSNPSKRTNRELLVPRTKDKLPLSNNPHYFYKICQFLSLDN